MELIDAITPYLGTETILVVDSKEHWFIIYDKLRKKKSTKFIKKDINLYTIENPLSITLFNKGAEAKANLKWFKSNFTYRNYKYIHTSELIKKLKFNNWLW